MNHSRWYYCKGETKTKLFHITAYFYHNFFFHNCAPCSTFSITYNLKIEKYVVNYFYDEPNTTPVWIQTNMKREHTKYQKKGRYNTIINSIISKLCFSFSFLHFGADSISPSISVDRNVIWDFDLASFWFMRNGILPCAGKWNSGNEKFDENHFEREFFEYKKKS